MTDALPLRFLARLLLCLPVLAAAGCDLLNPVLTSDVNSQAPSRPPPAVPAAAPRSDSVEVTPLGRRDELRPGTGPTARPIAPALRIEPGDAITLDFVDADVATVARTVLGDLLHMDYALDPRVQGRITLQTARPLPRAAALSSLEDALRLNGAALVPAGGSSVRIVPAEQARFALGAAAVGFARGPGWRTQIVPLRYANAADIAKTLEQVAPAGAAIHADPAHNLVFLTASGTEIGNLLDVVQTLDVDSMAGASFGLFRLQVVEAKAMVQDLTRIFGGPAATDRPDGVRFVPIQRLNAVLAITRSPAGLRRVQDWVDRLDKVADGNDPQLYVYRVASGRASHLAEVVSKLFPDQAVERAGKENQGETAPGRAATDLTGAGYPGTAPAASRGSPAYQGGGLANGSFFGATVPAQGPAPAAAATPAVSAIPLPGTAAAPTANPLGGGPPPLEGETAQEPPATPVRVVADTVNNTLLVLARPAVYQRIEQTLRKLDVMPAQVQIEATIAEVQLNNALRFGVEAFLKSHLGFNLTDAGNAQAIAQSPAFTFSFTSGNTNVVLEALRQVTDVTVVSSPTMMVLDNETANLQVGDQVPIITATAQSVQNTNTPIINQIDYRDTGVILSVTPRVTASGAVLMTVRQEVSDVEATTSSSINSPSFQRRRFDSSIAVADNQTVALGGLIRTNHTQNRTGVPFLSELPVVGSLFGTRVDQVTRNELIVLITPRVVRTAPDAAAATQELRQRMLSSPPTRANVLP